MPTPEEAIEILRESGCSPNVIRHCRAVAEIAVKIALKCRERGIPVDLELIRIGALLHDLGRSKTHSVHHPIVGAKIAEELGLPEAIIRIIKRHIGGGLTAEEAAELGWPVENYLPETLEEKIVTYADKLVDGDKVVPLEKTIEEFKRKLGEDHPSIKRIMNLHREIMELCGGSIE
ncbi:TIGR00295 family protein [Candidatus Bathyarchaeota archaeon]|nr:TIGR00295 family protein [Candidatus Bathyarchaeota archaeon]